MSECRACLINDVRMHIISNTRYQEIYEKLSGTKLITDNGRPNTICYVCNALLQKFCEFFDMSQKAEQMLTKRILEGVEISQEKEDKMNIINLTMTATQAMSFVDDGTEEEPEVTVTVKEEPVEHDEWEQFKEYLDSGDEILNNGDTAMDTRSMHEYLPKCTSKEPNTPNWPAFQNTEHNQNDIRIKTEAPETNNEENNQNYKNTIEFQNFCKALNIMPLKPDFKYLPDINKGRKTNESRHTCSKCNYTCPLAKTLRRHMKVHDLNNQYSCELCFYRFKDEKKLATHRNRCTVCNVCNKKFKNVHGLRIHMRLHTGEQPFSCDYCGRGFNQKTNLQTHLRVHARHKQYPCDKCHKTFPFDSFLKRHKLMHEANPLDFESMNRIVNCHKLYTRKKSSESLSSCSVCGKVLQSKGLNMHMRLHSGERPFTCERCGRGFNQKCNLLVHVERVHTGDEMFTCKVCFNVFPLTSELNRHFLTHTNVKLEIKSEFLHELQLNVKRELDLLRYTEWNVALKRDSLNDTERDVELQRDLLTHINGNIESKRDLSSHTEGDLELKRDFLTHSENNPELTDTKENIENDTKDNHELTNHEDNLEFTETVENIEFTVIEVNPEKLTDTEDNLELNNAQDNLQSINTGENPEITDTKENIETYTEDNEDLTDTENIRKLMNAQENLEFAETLDNLELTVTDVNLELHDTEENLELSDTEEYLELTDIEESLELTDREDNELTDIEENLELNANKWNQGIKRDWSTYTEDYLELERDLLSRAKKDRQSERDLVTCTEENLEFKREVLSDNENTVEKLGSTVTEWEMELVGNEEYLDFKRDLFIRTEDNEELKREMLSDTEEVQELTDAEDNSELLTSTEDNLESKDKFLSDTEEELDFSDRDDNLEFKRNLLTDIEDNLQSKRDLLTCTEDDLEFKRELLSDTEQEQELTDTEGNPKLTRDLLTCPDENLQLKRYSLTHTDKESTECKVGLTSTENNIKSERRTERCEQLNHDMLTLNITARDYEIFQQKHIFMIHRKLHAGENTPYTCDMCATRIFSY